MEAAAAALMAATSSGAGASGSSSGCHYRRLRGPDRPQRSLVSAAVEVPMRRPRAGRRHSLVEPVEGPAQRRLQMPPSRLHHRHQRTAWKSSRQTHQSHRADPEVVVRAWRRRRMTVLPIGRQTHQKRGLWSICCCSAWRPYLDLHRHRHCPPQTAGSDRRRTAALKGQMSGPSE